MTLDVIDYDEVWRRLPVAAAVDALEAAVTDPAFRDTPQRTWLADGDRQLLLMPSFAGGGAGVKLITIDPRNPERGVPLINGVFVLFGTDGLQPQAVIDGRALTEMRTGAVSALATRHLARRDASRLVVFGAGAQGHAHVRAMAAVRHLAEVGVVARRAESADALVEFTRTQVGVATYRAEPDAVAQADIVCTCTSSTTPVFDGALLPAGVHVNAVGAYRPDMREVDDTTVTGCRVVVETRAAALAEAGDLLIPRAAGRWDDAAISADLCELVTDPAAARRDAAERTLFKSVGVAFEDLVVARALVSPGAGTPPP